MARGQTLVWRESQEIIHGSWPCTRPDPLDTLLEFCFSSSFAIFLMSSKIAHLGC